MYRIKSAALVCAVLVLLTGCAEKETRKYYAIDESKYTLLDFIEIKTEFSEYESGSLKELKYTITNNGSDMLWFGYAFELHKFDDESGEWKGVMFDKDTYFFQIAFGLSPSESVTRTIELEKMFDLPLPTGRYRLRKIEGGGYSDAEFTII